MSLRFLPLLFGLFCINYGLAQTDCLEFDLSDFTFNGSAHLSGDEAILTPPANAQFGAIWANNRIDLNDDFLFETELYFGTNPAGADGIAFVLQPLSNNQGAQGGGIGYQGIVPSIAIEFDTYFNAGTDPFQNDHIAVVRDGLAQSLPAHSEFVPPYNAGFLKDGSWYTAVFEWDASSQTLQLTFNGALVISVQLDLINEIFGGQNEVYWGFTSATGGANNLHKIKIENYCVTVSLCEGLGQIEASQNDICVGDQVILNFDLDPEINGTFLWSTGSTASTIVVSPEFTTTYYLEIFLEEETCVKEITIEVKFEVYSPLGDGYQTFCDDPPPTVGDIVVDGENIKWYDSPFGGIQWDDSQLLFTGQVVYASQTIDGCESQTRLMVLVEIFESSSSEIHINSCESISWNGQIYNESGEYSVNLTNVHGCDSLATLFLTIEEEINTEFDVTACESYGWNGETYTQSGIYIEEFTNSQGCDSFAILNLTVVSPTSSSSSVSACKEYSWNGSIYSESGTYMDTLVNVAGCDSILTLILDILEDEVSTETVVVCETYFWQVTLETYSSSGVYSDTLINSNGCDSILILDLSILADFVQSENVSACESYFWPVTGEEYNASGEYSDTLISSLGCDSILILNLEIFTGSIHEELVEICDNYTWDVNGETYTESGNYSETLFDVNGCDSILILNLTIRESFELTQVLGNCEEYFWTANNQIYTESGLYITTLQTEFGCDSIIHLDLTIYPQESSTTIQETCDSFLWDISGEMYSESGIYTYVLPTVNGCDSIVTLDLTILSGSFLEESIIVCESYIWPITGIEYTVSGTYSETYQNSFGCDSLLVLNLTVQNSEVTTDNVTECDFYLWEVNGVTYSRSGVYDHMLATVNGCDSLMVLNLEIYLSETVVDPIASCGSFTWAANDQIYTESGTYTEFLVTSNGCDSIAILELEILPTSDEVMVMTDCDEYFWSVTGQTYTQSGIYTQVLTNAVGCDSIVSLDLSLNFSVENSQAMKACDYYNWLVTGQDYFESGTYSEVLNTSYGCDSIVTLNLEINQNYTNIEQVYACEEFTWEVDGNTYTSSGVYELELLSGGGCDSILLLELNISSDYEQYEQVSAEDEYYWPVTRQTYKESGEYSELFETAGGCDSLRVLLLDLFKPEKVFVPNVFSPNGDGINDFLSVFTSSGIEKIDKFQIFDRWGGLVFSMEDFAPNDETRGWNGTHRGQYAGTNVFVYYVEYTNSSGYKRIVKGDVTLLR